jgi:restriction endonuclease S subunit
MLKRYLNLPVSVPPKKIQIDLVAQVQTLHNQALSLRNQAQSCLDQASQEVEKLILGEAQ